MENKADEKMLAQYIECRNKTIVAGIKDVKGKEFVTKHLRNSKNCGEGNIGLSNNGFHNSGVCNLGALNSGTSNIGDYNAGYENIGDYNSGRFNVGNHNSGECNVGDCNAGIFNTDEPNMRAFNKETDIKYSTWRKSKDYIDFYELQIVEFIRTSEMTDKEKTLYPEHKTMNGYIKKISLKTAWSRWWKKNKSEEMKLKIKKLPNFDNKIFKGITGIDIT